MSAIRCDLSHRDFFISSPGRPRGFCSFGHIDKGTAFRFQSAELRKDSEARGRYEAVPESWPFRDFVAHSSRR